MLSQLVREPPTEKPSMHLETQRESKIEAHQENGSPLHPTVVRLHVFLLYAVSTVLFLPCKFMKCEMYFGP